MITLSTLNPRKNGNINQGWINEICSSSANGIVIENTYG